MRSAAHRLDQVAPKVTGNPATGPSGADASRIREALRIAAAAAYRVPGVLPAFERLEGEAARLASTESALSRAARLAEGLA